jgi:hypothetical protein
LIYVMAIWYNLWSFCVFISVLVNCIGQGKSGNPGFSNLNVRFKKAFLLKWIRRPNIYTLAITHLDGFTYIPMCTKRSIFSTFFYGDQWDRSSLIATFRYHKNLKKKLLIVLNW